VVGKKASALGVLPTYKTYIRANLDKTKGGVLPVTPDSAQTSRKKPVEGELAPSCIFAWNGDLKLDRVRRMSAR